MVASGGRWELDLDGNQLHVAPYSKWIACRFENEPMGAIRTAALRNGESLNPFSFKWNFHFTIEEPGAKEAREFGLALCSLMPLEKAAPLVDRLNGVALIPGSKTIDEYEQMHAVVLADVEQMRVLFARVGFDATVKAYHGVSIRLAPPAGTYFGLHTRPQFLAAVRRIEAGEPPLDVLRSVAG